MGYNYDIHYNNLGIYIYRGGGGGTNTVDEPGLYRAAGRVFRGVTAILFCIFTITH